MARSFYFWPHTEYGVQSFVVTIDALREEQ
jgi:hypothetical protein